MDIFDPTQGPVTTRSIEKGVSFEVFQALQNDKTVGVIRFDWTRGGAGIVTLVGHGHVVYLPLYFKHLTAWATRTGKFTYFCDYWEVPSYDSTLRVGFTEWLIKNQEKDDGGHILVGSKLISMGVAVANAAIGGRHVNYTSRAEFEGVVVKHGLPTKRPVPR